MIVDQITPITLVGGGEATAQDVQKALTHAPFLVAADGGAAIALAAGVLPEAVIGDFDSLSDVVRGQIPGDRLYHVAEQDSTDFAKCLMRIRAPAIMGVGFTGKRIDHQLAALNSLVVYAHQTCLLLGAEEVIFHAPPHLKLNLDPGTVVSLFPLRPVRGRSSGLEWPIEGIDFAPGGPVGTSNRALGPVIIDMDDPGMLVIVPRRFIQPVWQALLQTERAQWPVRAG